MFKWLRNQQQLEKKHRRLVRIGLLAIFALTVGTAAWATIYYRTNRHNSGEQEQANNVEIPNAFDLSQIDTENLDSLTILLAGYGGSGHQGGFLSDVIQVAHINFKNETISLISIPRDLYLNEGYKVNAVMSNGMAKNGTVKDGLELMRQTMSQITGLPIAYFVGIDFVGFKRTIGNELGSVEVQVAQTLDDPWYPIDGAQLEPCGYSPEEIAQLSAQLSGFALESKFACRYEHIHFEPGTVKMEGHDALAYVRSRHSSSDYDRSRRQAEVLQAIRDKLFKLEVLTHLPNFYQAISKHVVSNLDLESATKIAPLLINGHRFQIKSINLSPENVLTSSTSNAGAFILLPKAGATHWQEVQAFIKQQL